MLHDVIMSPDVSHVMMTWGIATYQFPLSQLTFLFLYDLFCTPEGQPSYFDFRFKNHLYKVSRDDNNGYEAKKYCSRLGLNSSLAVLESREEAVRIKTENSPMQFASSSFHFVFKTNCQFAEVSGIC